MEARLLQTLKQYWGYDSFRPTQLEVIESVCCGVDTLALMPTGGGKSLLYQLPTLAGEGICIVVTPLIALMKDQVDRLRKMGVSACAIHSGLSNRQIDILLDNCVYGDVRFLYIAPERIATETFRMRVLRMNVSLIAVDEAHCISQWGYDFRPSYLRIAELRKLAPDAPVLALTASATDEVVGDIMRHLKFRDGVVMRASFARPNLSYSVRPTDDKPAQLLRIVRNVHGTGIVYVRTREATEQVANLLRQEGFPAEAYNGGMNHTDRSARQDNWTDGRTRIMVATNAFGMGIDKADVRYVVHYDMPDSPEAYYQEAGRAGRDGFRSYAVLLFGPDEAARAARRFSSEFPSMELIRNCYEGIFNYLQIGIGEGKGTAFSFDTGEFSARMRLYPTVALSAIKILQQNGYLTLTDETDNPPRIMFIVSRDDLYKIRVDRGELDHFLRTVLRLCNGVFNGFVTVDEEEIASVSGYTTERVKELFKSLWDLRVIRYIPGNRSPRLFLSEERLPVRDIIISPESYRLRKEIGARRLESLLRYAENDTECRSGMLQHYFGEENPAPCGVCDICLRHKKEGRFKPEVPSTKTADQVSEGAQVGVSAFPSSGAAASAETSVELLLENESFSPEERILELLAAGPMNVKEVLGHFFSPSRVITDAIDRLLLTERIGLDKGGRIGLRKPPGKSSPIRKM